MFDINAIVNAAISAAVQQAIDPLVERIAALEQNEEYLTNRIARLEAAQPAAAPQPVGVDPKTLAEASLNYLNDQEWFWEKMQNRIDAATEQAIDAHCADYDHDSYDAVVSDSDDFVKSDDLEDTVREAIGNMTFEVSVS